MRGPDPSLRYAPFRMTNVTQVQDEKSGVGSEPALSVVEGMTNMAQELIIIRIKRGKSSPEIG